MSLASLAVLSEKLSSKNAFQRAHIGTEVKEELKNGALKSSDLISFLSTEITNKNSVGPLRTESIILAGRIAAHELVPELLSVLIDEESDEVTLRLRSKAAWALSQMGKATTRLLAVTFLKPQIEEQGKEYLLLIAANIAASSSFPVLELAVRDSSPFVRFSAYQGMSKILKRADLNYLDTYRSRIAENIAVTIQKEDHAWVLASVAELLGEITFAKSEVLFRQIFERKETEVRRPAAEALTSPKVGARPQFIDDILSKEKEFTVQERLKRAKALAQARIASKLDSNKESRAFAFDF